MLNPLYKKKSIAESFVSLHVIGQGVMDLNEERGGLD